jgi:hypothetical protein
MNMKSKWKNAKRNEGMIGVNSEIWEANEMIWWEMKDNEEKMKERGDA